MFDRIQQVLRIGRFHRWNARSDDLRLKPLTSIYGRNASGKSTLVRAFRAAAGQDPRELQLDHSLGAEAPPELTLKLADGHCRFDGTQWVGNVPKVVVFDRDFIEANVYTGRRSTKDHRRQLLSLALGATDVAHARRLDELTRRGKKLASTRREHDAAIRTAAESTGFSTNAFLALPELDDPQQVRAEAEARLTRATRSAELRKRARPTVLPDLPHIDIAKIRAVLGATAKTIGDEAEQKVRAHLDGRLRGVGETWIRTGLAFATGTDCPFCQQELDDKTPIALYRQWFDRHYDDLLTQVQDHLARVAALSRWWSEVASIGRSNLAAFSSWDDLEGFVRPSFDSRSKQAQLDEVCSTLTRILTSKQNQMLQPHLGTDLVEVEKALASLTMAVTAYNDAISRMQKSIEERLHLDAALTVEEARAQLTRVDAAILRHSAKLTSAVEELTKIEDEHRSITREKQAADELLKQTTQERLGTFVMKANRLLSLLGADFELDQLATERVGGTTGARFTLVVDGAALIVSDAHGEERFARVLSDGDRSTLAFALFLLHLEELQDLDKHVVVIDDPMTSQDSQRTEATAEHITKLVGRCQQVIVFSHSAAFLECIGRDWRRHYPGRVDDLAELELDRGTRALRPWSSGMHQQNEHTRRIEELEEFVNDAAMDRNAARMRGEIRKLLEAYVRHSYPELFELSPSNTLEPVIRALQSDDSLRQGTRFSTEDVVELDRLCAFGARGSHDQSMTMTEPPAPEATRVMAKRALQLVRRGVAPRTTCQVVGQPLPSS